MPKLLKEDWPPTVAVRIPRYGNGPQSLYGDEARKILWKGYLKWKNVSGAWSRNVSDFIREAIWEKIQKLDNK